ncbi:MAG: hypothetical protein KDJ36_03535, partial [Hyphomicrobiaceae bacterium]|nr:hypothetical protein [Hyphomicrobiaceae bacterium]
MRQVFAAMHQIEGVMREPGSGGVPTLAGMVACRSATLGPDQKCALQQWSAYPTGGAVLSRNYECGAWSGPNPTNAKKGACDNLSV